MLNKQRLNMPCASLFFKKKPFNYAWSVTEIHAWF